MIELAAAAVPYVTTQVSLKAVQDEVFRQVFRQVYFNAGKFLQKTV